MKLKQYRNGCEIQSEEKKYSEVNEEVENGDGKDQAKTELKISRYTNEAET